MQWRRRHGWLLAVVVAVALLLRLLFWLDQGRAGVVFSGDADEYYRGAVHLYLDGSYYDDGQWLRPPLTSLFWAACFWLLSPNLPGAMLAQCALGALTVLFVADIARRLFTSPRAGVVAALLGAVYLPYAAIASQALSETVFIFAVALSLWLLVLLHQREQPSLWLILTAGAALGTAALARPVGLYALPFLLLWLALRQNNGTGRKLRIALMPALMLLTGFVLVVAPWTLRNYRVYNQLVLVDTNGGVSFWFGTIRDPSEQKMQDVWKATLPNSALRQQAALQLGWENIKADPWRYLSRTRNKVVSLWQLETRLFAGNAATGITWEEGSLGYTLAADALYVGVMLLALVALALSLSHERSWPLIGWPLYGTLLSALTLGHPRLRLPLLIPLLVYASLPLAHPRLLLERWRAAHRLRKLVAAGLCALFLLMLYASAYRSFVVSQFWLLGARLSADNKELLNRAVAADPHGFLPWIAQGDAARAQQQTDAALAFYQEASERAPRNVYARARQIEGLLAQGDLAGAEAQLQAIRAVDWDNNLLYQWAWRHVSVTPAPRLDMDGAGDLGSISGFYRVEREGDTSYRWAMGTARMRLGSADEQAINKLRIRLRADMPNTPVEVWVDGAPRAVFLASPEWQTVEPSLLTPTTSAVVVEVRSPARIHSPQQPYARGVAIDWLEGH